MGGVIKQTEEEESAVRGRIEQRVEEERTERRKGAARGSESSYRRKKQ